MKAKKIYLDFLTSVLGRFIEPVYLALYLVYAAFKRKITNWKFCVFFLILLMHGLIMSIFTGYDTGKIFQQTLLLFITLFGYLQLYNKVTVEYVFTVYLKFVLGLAILGLLQYAAYVAFGINIFPYTLDMFETQTSDRLHSILLEPGCVMSFFSPAVCYVILSKTYFTKNRLKSLVILLAFLLTFSSASIVCLILAFGFRYYERLKKYRIFYYFAVILLAYYLLSLNYGSKTFSDSDNVVDRATGKLSESMFAVFSISSGNISPYVFEGLNASSYAQLTNYWIAFNAPYRLVGTGIGTHKQNYETSYKSNYVNYGLNEDDAYSLFARLLSEFGYIGLCFYIIFVVKYFNKNNIFSFCFLNFIICYLIKGGHYTLYCAALFHVLYYKCYKTKQLKS